MAAQPFQPQAARAALDLIAAAATADDAQHRRDARSACRRRWPTTSGRCAPRPSWSARSRAIDELTQRARRRARSATAARSTCARLDWFDLRNMLLVARVVTQAALARTESRGAHQREDFPGMLPEWRVNQVARLRRRPASTLTPAPPSPSQAAAQ